MENKISTISCPNCGQAINVNEILAHQLEDEYRKKYNDDRAQEQRKYKAQMHELEEQKSKLQEEQALAKQRIDAEVHKKLESQKESFREQIKTVLQKEQATELKTMQDELAAKSLQLQELNKTKAEIERLKREKAEQRDQIKAESEKALNQKIAEEKIKIKEESEKNFAQKLTLLEEENLKNKAENKSFRERELGFLRKERAIREEKDNLELDYQKTLIQEKEKIAAQIREQENEKNKMVKLEYQKQLDDQKSLIEEMKRKADQGSMQMQGEVQELALEDLLNAAFPFDSIDEVAKGVRGADVIQTVRNSLQQVCGKILYESKRTKTFSDGWIDKLKNDQRNQQAELAIIVTEAMPRDMHRFGQKSGVWICTFQEVQAVAYVLREMVLKVHTANAAQENKGDKITMLYSYLTSAVFTQHVEAIVDGFSSMKIDLDKEKRAMQRIWKTREKQIEKVVENTVDMYASIKGIAGNAVGTVHALELGPGE